MKRTMYITDLDVALRKRSERIVIERKGEEIAEIRCDELDTIILLGPIEFSTQVLFKLAQHGIELAICNSRGKLIAQLTPPCSLNSGRLIKQIDLFRDSTWALESAKNTVRAKLSGCISLLEDSSRNMQLPAMKDAISALKEIKKKVEVAETIGSLLGIEGSAGNVWFAAFGLMLKDRDFDGRNRRPPRDPINAMLSLGYSLTASEISGLIDACGLNPFFGFYHQLHYGRPVLALDLMEEFRARLVDRFVLRTFNLKQFAENDFEESGEGYLLKPDAFKRFLKLWEEYQMTDFNLPWGVKTFNEAFRASVEQLRKCIDAGSPYSPLPLGND